MGWWPVPKADLGSIKTGKRPCGSASASQGGKTRKSPAVTGVKKSRQAAVQSCFCTSARSTTASGNRDFTSSAKASSIPLSSQCTRRRVSPVGNDSSSHPELTARATRASAKGKSDSGATMSRRNNTGMTNSCWRDCPVKPRGPYNERYVFPGGGKKPSMSNK